MLRFVQLDIWNFAMTTADKTPRPDSAPATPAIPATPVTTVRLQNIALSYGQSAALMAAVDVGMFTAISNGAGTYAEVAAAINIHVTNAERLMVMLCASGLVIADQGRHRNAPDTERFLVQGKPGYMGPWITFTKPQWNEWGRLAEHIRNHDLSVMGPDTRIHAR